MNYCAVFEEFYAPIKKYVEREDIFDISFNEPGQIILDKLDGTKEFIEDKELTYEYWEMFASVLANITKQSFDVRVNPKVATMLPGNHRIDLDVGYKHLPSGLSCSIRIDRGVEFSLADYGIDGDFLREFVSRIRQGTSMVIVGDVGTGKTSFLKAVVSYFKRDEKLLTIEDANELVFPRHKNKSSYLVQRTADDIAKQYAFCINSSLRKNPTYLVLGEACAENTLSILQCANSGKKGFYTTVHANSSKASIDKFRYNLAAAQVNENFADSLVKSIDMFVMLRRVDNKPIVTEVWFPQEDRTEVLHGEVFHTEVFHTEDAHSGDDNKQIQLAS